MGTPLEGEITIVSTYTRDRRRLPDGALHWDAGGPAHYISQALTTLQRPYRVLTGASIDVDVIPTAEGQEYVIPTLPVIPLPRRFPGAASILSPVAGEIDPLTAPPADGILVVDLQGFVRQPGIRTDRSLTQYHLAPLLHRAQVVKASRAELDRLDMDSREALCHVLLLTTDGDRGAEIRRGHDVLVVEARPVDTHHTVGAGDTFLAAFVHFLLLGDGPGAAGGKAARFTEAFLLERSRTGG